MIIIIIEMIIVNCLAKSRRTLNNTHYGWTCSMEEDLRNILVNPYMETDDAGGGGGDDKGVSVCSLCEKLTEFWKRRCWGKIIVFGHDRNEATGNLNKITLS